MSSIVLSNAVRQNLLALQDTAASLATTQNRLSTGKQVNTALDNPTNFFTAAGLDNRASDISNLLDSISNGVQVLQSANTGITSLTSLVNSAKSIANQALQTQIGYSTKANIVSAAITNNGNSVVAADLRGAGTTVSNSVTGSAPTISTSSFSLTTTLASAGLVDGQTISDGTNTFTFSSTQATSGNTININTGTVGDLATAVHAANASLALTINGSNGITVTNSSSSTAITLSDGTGAAAGALASLGLVSGTVIAKSGGTEVGGAGTATLQSGTALVALGLTTSSTLTVNGKAISFVNNGSGNTSSANGGTLDLQTATAANLLTALDAISGGTSSIAAGAITLNTGTSNDLTLGGTSLTSLGLTAGTTQRTGLTLSFGAVGTGTATTVTFGDGTGGTVKSLADLNNALFKDNLVATLDSTGKLTVQTNNDNASASLPAVTGTATVLAGNAGAFAVNGTTGAVSTLNPVQDTAAQSTRASLIAQYNTILDQIDSTAADASYNGVNLLNGDQLQLTFNETGKSKLNITGVNFSSAGLGLSKLSSGSDFIDNNATNKILSTLNTVTTTLRSQASAFGSNLSVVQTRQDFNKNLINVLQTGSANLTQADMNTEAANSQALQTRQSLSVSALSLANQAQQSVLQLLR